MFVRTYRCWIHHPWVVARLSTTFGSLVELEVMIERENIGTNE